MKNYINKPDILKWYIYKILLIMRLITVILMVSMLQVSASTVAQEFNYVKKGASLIQIFKEIKKQTGYNIIWNEKRIDVTTTIDVNFKKANIRDVLNKCLSNLPLSYSINDKLVMIKEEESSFRDKIVSFFTAIDIRGRVVDEKNQPLVGATVKVKKSTRSTLTDDKGYFTLNNVEEESVLVISYVGYDTKEIRASENLKSISLMLTMDKLQEVEINAGYYTVTDRERTGAISRITSKDIQVQPVSNLLMSMVGRVPGLQITQQTGMPGGGFSVQIRGRNSINTTVDNDPLYIIDGSVYPSSSLSGGATSDIFGQIGTPGLGASPLSNINPNDIESIEVLKDADATAIYGSRGANGVILITTKKGLPGKIRVNANIDQGYNSVGHKVDLLNTEEYIAMRLEAFENDNLKPSTTSYDVNGAYNVSKYTDWQKVFIGGKAQVTNSSLNVTGGGDNNNYLISGNYYTEGTVFPGSYGLKRTSLRSSIDLGSKSDRFNATITASYSHLQQELPAVDLTRYILLVPNAPDLYDEYGELNYNNNTFLTNPFSSLFQVNNANMNSLVGGLSLSYRLFNNLSIKANLNYTSITRDEFLQFPLKSYPPALGYTSSNRTSLFSDNYNNNLLFEPQINYSVNVGDGKLSALIGASFQDSQLQYRTIQGSNYTSDQLMNNIAAAASITNRQMADAEYKYLATFLRLNYDLKHKYFINLTTRRDGSSRFGADKRFANFGAVGAAWIFSSEPFFKRHFSFINFGKLRASYGVTGNDQIGNYGYLQLWNSTQTYQGQSTITPGGQAPNPDYSWETNRKAEIAMQLGFLEDNANLEVSYYQNLSSNQLLANQLPPSTGLNSLFANSPGKVENTGWEFVSRVKLIESKNWNWTSSATFTLPQNKLLEYPELEFSSQAVNYQIGEPLTILKTYNVTVDKETGVYVIEDKNSNGIIDNADRYIVKFLGQSFFGGFQNSIRYKNFNLDFSFSFAKQLGKDYKSSNNLQPGRFQYGSELSNQVSAVNNRWRQPGDETLVQRFGTTATVRTPYLNSYTYGSLSVVDASYIRLRNVSLNYSIPQQLVSKLKLHNAVLSLRGQNLFTLTNYDGLDPETRTLSVLPPLRTLSINLNLTL